MIINPVHGGIFPNVDNIRWTITVLWIRKRKNFFLTNCFKAVIFVSHNK